MDSNIARFEFKQLLGEGSFSINIINQGKIFQAYDKLLKMDVALKVEKEDKNRKILRLEYEILKNLQGLPHVPKVFEFVENKTLNFIVLELLGKNVANYKKSKGNKFDTISSYNILLQMLDSIENLHNKGYIHRDIKPTNFVMGLKNRSEEVYMVDFGLAKLHLDRNSNALPPRINTDFRGTLTYASLNAHNKQELSRRDDLWSFFFVILDLLDEILPWRLSRDDKDEIKKKKEFCLNDPENFLLITTCRNKIEIKTILNHLKSLRYEDKPNYGIIRYFNRNHRSCLEELRMKEIKRLNLDSKFNKKDYPEMNNMTVPSQNLILWDFPRYNVAPDYFNNIAELKTLMKKERTLYSKNVPSYTNSSIQIEPKVSLSNLNSNISLFNNSLNQNNGLNFDNNGLNQALINNQIGLGNVEQNNNNNYNDIAKQLANIYNNQKNYNLNQQLNTLINTHSSNNQIFGQNNLNNIISKFAPNNKPKKEECANKPEVNQENNLNKKRTRDEDILNIENLLKSNNQTTTSVPNQQNQIFIINQYNKDALSSLIESTFLNILYQNNNNNPVLSQTTNPLNFLNNMSEGFNNYNNTLMNIKNFIMNNNNNPNNQNTNQNKNVPNFKPEDFMGILNNNQSRQFSKTSNSVIVNNNQIKSNQFENQEKIPNQNNIETYSQNLLKLIKNSDVNNNDFAISSNFENQNICCIPVRNKKFVFKIEKKNKLNQK